MNPYLSLNGQCEEAFELYEQSLGAQVGAMPYRDPTGAAAAIPSIVEA